jgi:hypothetical protein
LTSVKNKNVTVKIFDISGKVVFEKSQATENNFKIERGSLEAGIYFYELFSGTGNLFRGKFVIAD